MKKELIQQLHASFEARASRSDNVEYWFARELQELLGYTQWRNFEAVIERAKIACANAGQVVADHFADASKMVDIGSGTARDIGDIALTRYACYLIAQNGDPRKDAIAFAIKAKDFVNEITNTQVKQQDLHGEPSITTEHVKNNRDVRRLLTDRNIVPEFLPAAEDVKKLERRLKSEEKKLPKLASRTLRKKAKE